MLNSTTGVRPATTSAARAVTASTSPFATAPCGNSSPRTSATPPCAYPTTGRPIASGSSTVRPNDSGVLDRLSTQSETA